MIDIHSHILPEIDDGARSLTEAMQMAGTAVSDGIRQIVCTPHMFNGISNNPEPAEVIERVARLQDAVAHTGLRVYPGNEVHITHDIAQQAKSNRVTRLNNKNYMLVEFPSVTIPVGSEELFEALIGEGVHPILVHPERNLRFQTRPGLIADFVSRGVYVQVTAMSMTGEFGFAAQSCAEDLMRHNCVHFIASDAHRSERRPPILSKGRDAAAQIIGAEKAHRLVQDNPLAVLSGLPLKTEPLIPWDAPVKKSKSTFFGRLFGG
jgi:protein-tyrosine phosphatase